VKLTNEFTVGADVETVWRTLLDMEGVAGCLPGATVEATDQENHYSGSMRLKIGPMTVAYEGTATLVEVDEEARRAVISLRAREARGQGTALATITNVLEQMDGGTRVRAETDLRITGPQARFGRGMMEDVAGRVLSEFSSCLERQVARPAESVAEAPGADEQPAPAAGEALDIGALLSESKVGSYARAALPLLAALVAVVLLFRRRR
jgi:carbon monoxide dehydrogenase subunit G